MEINKYRIEEAVIQSVSESILENSDLESRIKAAVASRIDHHFKESGDAQISKAINQAVEEGFEHEYCRVNSFGQREGQPTTIRKELEKIVAGYWNTRVDKSNGNPSTSDYNTISRAEWVMLKITGNTFSEVMKQHIVNLGGSLKDELRKTLHETVNDLLSRVFYVQSEGDRQLNNPGHNCIDPKTTGKL